MKFKVTETADAGKAKFDVFTECGKLIDSFSTHEDALAKAAFLNAEYDRVSELL